MRAESSASVICSRWKKRGDRNSWTRVCLSPHPGVCLRSTGHTTGETDYFAVDPLPFAPFPDVPVPEVPVPPVDAPEASLVPEPVLGMVDELLEPLGLVLDVPLEPEP